MDTERDNTHIIDFAITIWTSILLALTLSVVNSTSASIQEAHSIMAAYGQSSSNLTNTTDPFAGFFIRMGLTFANYFSFVIVFLLLLVSLLIFSLWVSHHQTPVPQLHPRSVLYWTYMAGFILIIAFPFIIQVAYSSLIWFPSDPFDVTRLAQPSYLPRDVYATLVQLTTQASSGIIFARYFLRAARTIITAGFLWVLLSLGPKYRKTWFVVQVLGFGLLLVFLYYPPINYVGEYQLISQQAEVGTLPYIASTTVDAVDQGYRYLSMGIWVVGVIYEIVVGRRNAPKLKRR